MGNRLSNYSIKHINIIVEKCYLDEISLSMTQIHAVKGICLKSPIDRRGISEIFPQIVNIWATWQGMSMTKYTGLLSVGGIYGLYHDQSTILTLTAIWPKEWYLTPERNLATIAFCVVAKCQQEKVENGMQISFSAKAYQNFSRFGRP